MFLLSQLCIHLVENIHCHQSNACKYNLNAQFLCSDWDELKSRMRYVRKERQGLPSRRENHLKSDTQENHQIWTTSTKNLRNWRWKDGLSRGTLVNIVWINLRQVLIKKGQVIWLTGALSRREGGKGQLSSRIRLVKIKPKLLRCLALMSGFSSLVTEVMWDSLCMLWLPLINKGTALGL